MPLSPPATPFTPIAVLDHSLLSSTPSRIGESPPPPPSLARHDTFDDDLGLGMRLFLPEESTITSSSSSSSSTNNGSYSDSGSSFFVGSAREREGIYWTSTSLRRGSTSRPGRTRTTRFERSYRASGSTERIDSSLRTSMGAQMVGLDVRVRV